MLPSAAATSVASVSAAARPRVLVLRSCRPHVLDAALGEFRKHQPDAHFVALTHAGHRDALRQHGIGECIEIPGSRFGVLHLPVRTWLALRAARFSTVLVPMMWGPLYLHANLALLALVTGAARIAAYSPDGGLEQRGWWETCRDLVCAVGAVLVHRLDVPLALSLMLLAPLMPRRRPRTAEPRRVLHVISSWGVGGAQRQLAEFLQHSPADRYASDLFVLSRADGEFSSQHLRGHDVRIRYARQWPRLTPTMLEIARLCRAERYDVVHTWLFMANALGVAAARLAGTPRVISSVRNLSLWKRTWANQSWFRLADTLASFGSDVVTVNGTSLVADHGAWARTPARRIAVVPNGLSTDGLDLDRDAAARALRAQLGLSARTAIVGTVGRLAPEKDHALLITAWIAADLPDAHLVIVGDGPLRPALQARIDGTRAAITLLGESASARQVMAGFDLFVLPSRIEGFPNVLLEAAMLGVPVLATDVGASRDMVRQDEDLIPAGDPGALTTRLAGHLRDLDGPRRRAHARRAFVREAFTIDRMVERWVSLYDGADR